MSHTIRDNSGWSAKISYPNNLREIFNFILNNRTYENNIALYDLVKLESQVARWYQLFPTIRPFFAVKANADIEIVSKLNSLGLGYDCASKTELELVQRANVNTKENVIFAQPFKSYADLTAISNLGVKYATFDCVEELQKIAKFGLTDLKLLIRIEAKHAEAEISLDKFGAAQKDFIKIFETAARLGFDIQGVAFHVGLQASNMIAYYKAIETANEAWKVGAQFGYQMKILDIGGGFSSRTIDSAAVEIHHGLSDFFGDKEVTLIAEPGKFLTETIVSSCLTVVGKKMKEIDEIQKAFYFLSDGIYGTFGVLTTDKTRIPVPILFKDTENSIKIDSVFYGPTCSGRDEVLKCDFEEIDIGDKILFDNMGAYNTAVATDFNGIPMATHTKVYLDKDESDLI